MKFAVYAKLYEKYQAGQASDKEIADLMAHEDNFELSEISREEIIDHDQLRGKRTLRKLNKSAGNVEASIFRINTINNHCRNI
jgi:hypothetical protein